MRELGSFEARPVADRGANQLAFSPDGKFLAFTGGGPRSTRLQTLALESGSIATLSDALDDAQSLSWSASEGILFSQARGIWHISGEGDRPEPVTKLGDAEQLHSHPNPLPDGRGLLFSVLRSARYFVAFQSKRGEEHRILFEGYAATYVDTGHVVYGRSGSSELYAASFDPDTLEVGSPVVIASDVHAYDSDPQFSVGADGTLVYVPSRAVSSSVVWVDRFGREIPVHSAAAGYHSLDVSPDGGRFAMDAGRQRGVWVHDIERGTRLPVAPTAAQIPFFSPDGNRIAYSGNGNIFIRAADGTGDARPLHPRVNHQVMSS